MMAAASPSRVVVIGAGIGGLTTAALLLQAGLRVTVLEAHVYPGGSAGTFFHKGYRFDAGATLAGGFSAAGPHARVAELLDLSWPVTPVDPAWVVHVGDQAVTQWADPARWQEERRAAFPGSEPFWRQQERLAGIAWDLSTRPFPWPPASPRDWVLLAAALRPRTLLAAPYLFRSIGSMLPPGSSPTLRTFLDALLLISAQTTSSSANALYGSAALDLPRRGVNEVSGGTGGLARALADWITQNGGKVLYRQQVEQIILRGGRAAAVRTRKGLEIECDLVAANLTPWGLAHLLGESAPQPLQREVQRRAPGWGSFTLYLGLPDALFPPGFPAHHQVIADPSLPLGSGNSIFLSLSRPGDLSRAPAGMRAATISTHTRVEDWWALAGDPQAYAEKKARHTAIVFATLERLLPGAHQSAGLILPATPLTYAFYTRRPLGMVGGFAQTSLFSARGPRTGISNLWLVGDSIFPGQSTAGVTLGALRVAGDILARG